MCADFTEVALNASCTTVAGGFDHRTAAAAATEPQVCDYLSEGEGPQDAVERAQQLLQIKTLQPSSVVEVEQPGELKADVVAAAAAVVKNSGCSSSSSSRSVCSGPVLAAAAAGLVAAVSVGVAYMSLGQQ